MLKNDPKRITREELYELVWKLSLKKVGDMYGVSDATIRKKCKSFNIPLPDNSYRGKLNTGQNPERRPLLKREGENIITFEEVELKLPYLKKDFDYLEEPLRSKVSELYKNLKAPEEKVRNHKLVIAYNDEMAERNKHFKKNKYSFNYVNRKRLPVLDFGNVTKENLPRAFKICNVLFKALEEIECTITVELNKPSVISFRGVKIGFRFKEKCNRVLPFEIDKNKHWYQSSELIPNGKLAFTYSSYSSSGHSYSERQVVDTDSLKIEEKIDSIFKKILDFSQGEIEKQIAACERHKIYELERLEKERIKEIRDLEIKKVQLLLQKSMLWEKADNLRKYIDILVAKTNSSDKEKEYIEWAREKADWIDPTVDNGGNILKDITEEDEILEMIVPQIEENTNNRFW